MTSWKKIWEPIDLKWAQSEATLHAWRLSLLMYCKSSLDGLTLIERWWHWMLPFDAFWCTLIYSDYVCFLLQVIAAFLNENSTIRFLNLETCLIKDAGVEARCVLHLSEREWESLARRIGMDPGWVWLPPCVVTLTPPLRPLCPMCRGMENFIFVSNQCQIISRNEARYTNNIGIKLPIACWFIAILHETDSLRPVAFVDSFLWRVSVFERRLWLRHCEATLCWPNWNCTATMLDPKEPRQGREIIIPEGLDVTVWFTGFTSLMLVLP